MGSNRNHQHVIETLRHIALCVSMMVTEWISQDAIDWMEHLDVEI